ncbi:MAG: hypothetical protein HGA44_05895 [Cellulomonadaceae bacterium]|nr:hypothetical protein [Cellulomonadaceae bacterium]
MTGWRARLTWLIARGQSMSPVRLDRVESSGAERASGGGGHDSEILQAVLRRAGIGREGVIGAECAFGSIDVPFLDVESNGDTFRLWMDDEVTYYASLRRGGISLFSDELCVPPASTDLTDWVREFSATRYALHPRGTDFLMEFENAPMLRVSIEK